LPAIGDLNPDGYVPWEWLYKSLEASEECPACLDSNVGSEEYPI
jgi:hypothetical protein